MGEQVPFVQGSDTSKEAAKSVRSKVETMRMKILSFVKEQGVIGATDEEIQDALHMDGNTERPRRCELVKKGLVRKSGARRRTSSGRNATVWMA